MQQAVTAQTRGRWRLPGGRITPSESTGRGNRELFSVTEFELRNRTSEPDGRPAADAEAASAPAADEWKSCGCTSATGAESLAAAADDAARGKAAALATAALESASPSPSTPGSAQTGRESAAAAPPLAAGGGGGSGGRGTAAVAQPGPGPVATSALATARWHPEDSRESRPDPAGAIEIKCHQENSCPCNDHY
jgi:hypothetical protein